MSETFVAQIIQYMRPKGIPMPQYTDLPIEVKPAYDEMLLAGCRLEAEVLLTDEVSVTISDGEQDYDHSITPNGPEVGEGLIKMLRRKTWQQKISGLTDLN